MVGWSSNTTGISFSQEVTEVTDSLVSGAQCNSSRGYGGHLSRNSLCVDNIGCDVSQLIVSQVDVGCFSGVWLQ